MIGSVRGYADSRRPKDGGASCRRPARSVRAKPPTTRLLPELRRRARSGHDARGGPAVGAPAAAAAAAPPAPHRPAPPVPAYKFDAARWSLADRIAGVATIVLFISLFLPWFTVSIGFASGSVNGLWHGWMYISDDPLHRDRARTWCCEPGGTNCPVGSRFPHLTMMMVGDHRQLGARVHRLHRQAAAVRGVGWGFGAVLGLIAAIVAAAPLRDSAAARRRRPM